MSQTKDASQVEVAHTPTPWVASGYHAFTADGTVVAGTNVTPGPTYPECRANIAFLVRAANAHDALVEALTGYVRQEEEQRAAYHATAIGQVQPREESRLLAAARAAITLATEGR